MAVCIVRLNFCCRTNTVSLYCQAPRYLFQCLRKQGIKRLSAVQVNYHPSKQYDIDDNMASKVHGTAWTESPVSGPRVKQMIEKENNFGQPGEYYRSFDRESKDVFQGHLVTFMTHPKTSDAVAKTWIGYMHKVSISMSPPCIRCAALHPLFFSIWSWLLGIIDGCCYPTWVLLSSNHVSNAWSQSCLKGVSVSTEQYRLNNVEFML